MMGLSFQQISEYSDLLIASSLSESEHVLTPLQRGLENELDRMEGKPLPLPTLLHPSERYWPHEPTPKQRTFLDLDCLEAFYGGAAAGGKSEALLMAALQYVHVPGYAALILRRDTQRLALAGGLIPRAAAWLAESGAAWHSAARRWSFPTAGRRATLTFGYLQVGQDKYRYASSEFQFIAFDELTEFPEEDYLFLFSRLRKPISLAVPLRMRSASNPGNLGHDWVKRRFVGDDALRALRDGAPAELFWQRGAAFVPARIPDNPWVNEQEYSASLSHLPPLFRERLMHGDWSIRAEGLIRPEWLRDYVASDRMLQLFDGLGRPLARFDERNCRRIVTIDPAGTSAERAAERRGRPASWSVAEVWDLAPRDFGPWLLLRHVWRERVGFDGLCAALRRLHAEWRPARMYIEHEKLGQAACDLLGRDLPLEPIATGGRDKVARAAPLVLKLERGEIFLPRHETSWRPVLESEWLGWTGLDEETTDQIDAAAYAVASLDSTPGEVVKIGRVAWR